MHVKGTIPTNFVLVKPMLVDTHGKILVMMTIGSPTTTMFASIDVPPNLKGEPLNPLGSSIRIIGKFVLSFFWPYSRPLNYLNLKNILI